MVGAPSLPGNPRAGTPERSTRGGDSRHLASPIPLSPSAHRTGRDEVTPLRSPTPQTLFLELGSVTRAPPHQQLGWLLRLQICHSVCHCPWKAKGPKRSQSPPQSSREERWHPEIPLHQLQRSERGTLDATEGTTPRQPEQGRP